MTQNGLEKPKGGSRGVMFLPEQWERIELLMDEHFSSRIEYPTLKMGTILTGLISAGLVNPDCVDVIKEHINRTRPDNKVAKASKAIEDMNDEQRLALINDLRRRGVLPTEEAAE